ncbi:MAG: hypothetical protein E1N59_2498 [Puniceicoccaceae bacterium 5H]|nr:MAG: hypothetical protein E1N59_2498 [Puniceicoccaceae bacterium 5H]
MAVVAAVVVVVALVAVAPVVAVLAAVVAREAVVAEALAVAVVVTVVNLSNSKRKIPFSKKSCTSTAAPRSWRVAAASASPLS